MRSSPYGALFFDRSGASFSPSATKETPHIYGRRIFSQIHGLHCHQHAHVQRNRDHRPLFHQAQNSLWRSTAPVTGTRKISMHAAGCAGAINTSTNSGPATLVGGAAPFTRLRKLT